MHFEPLIQKKRKQYLKILKDRPGGAKFIKLQKK